MNIQPSVIKNGFRKSGLFPLDPENIDFSKCLGKSVNDGNTELLDASASSIFD
jgi:hypothetical protein